MSFFGWCHRLQLLPHHIAETELLSCQGRPDQVILVDCSHETRPKTPALQPRSCASFSVQIAAGTNSIMGAMIESNLAAGNQAFPQPKDQLALWFSSPILHQIGRPRITGREIHAALGSAFR